jgi:hypothetical protein
MSVVGAVVVTKSLIWNIVYIYSIFNIAECVIDNALWSAALKSEGMSDLFQKLRNLRLSFFKDVFVILCTLPSCKNLEFEENIGGTHFCKSHNIGL